MLTENRLGQYVNTHSYHLITWSRHPWHVGDRWVNARTRVREWEDNMLDGGKAPFLLSLPVFFFFRCHVIPLQKNTDRSETIQYYATLWLSFPFHFQCVILPPEVTGNKEKEGRYEEYRLLSISLLHITHPIFCFLIPSCVHHYPVTGL